MKFSTATRLDSVQEYYFSRKLREVRALTLQGKPIINMAIGSPDLPAPDSVVSALEDSLKEQGVHQYQSYQGLPELRQAIAQFYQKQYSVCLDADTEILPLMGSKEGIMHISMAFLNAGDVVLLPNPGYPTYASVTNLLQAEPVYYNLTSENNWLIDFEELENLDEDILKRCKLLWVNYPHMPTGATASQEMYKRLITFAKKHEILIINDNPYSFILNDTLNSILSIEGAKEVCLELNSLSKTFNMAGWRVGMVSGNAHVLQQVLKVKSNIDSGMFKGIQKGAIKALELSTTWYNRMNSVYKERQQAVYTLCEVLGVTFDTDAVGLFVWAKLPQGINEVAFIDKLLYEYDIFITPGSIFGTQGKGYIRFSLCSSIENIEIATSRIIARPII